MPLGDALQWNLAFFRTDVSDDILFTQTETTGAGFFQNVAKTRRQGVEVGLQGSAWKRLKYYLSYAFVDATYQTNVTLASVTDPNGIQVKPGTASPASPSRTSSSARRSPCWTTSGLARDVISVSGNYLRGDDGNQQAKVSGHTVLNLNVRYIPVKHLEIWGRVENATNASYATAGALNWDAFADPISVQRFVAPGAPIGGWAGVKVRF